MLLLLSTFAFENRVPTKGKGRRLGIKNGPENSLWQILIYHCFLFLLFFFLTISSVKSTKSWYKQVKVASQEE